MDRLDPKWAGYYFDPRHAVAEGGGGAWKAATHLVAPRMKMMSLKDFYWEKTAKGWVIRNCPMGDGAVDWAWFGKVLAEARFAGPISLHFEYEIPGRDREGAHHQHARRRGEGSGLREEVLQVADSARGASDPADSPRHQVRVVGDHPIHLQRPQVVLHLGAHVRVARPPPRSRGTCTA